MRKKLFALLALVLVISSCEKDKILVPTILYVGESNTFTLSANGEKREIEIKTSADLKLTSEQGNDWCKAEIAGDKLVVTVDPNARLTDRTATLTLAAPDRKLEVIIRQNGQPSIGMTVVKAEASSASANYNIGVSYDGDFGNGFFVTNATDAVHELTYYLERTDKVQLVGVMYYPRLPNATATTPAAGNFSTGSISVSKNSNPTSFQKVMDFDMEKTAKTTFIEFPAVQTDVYAVKFSINGGAASQSGSASVREFVFTGTGLASASEKFVIPTKTLQLFGDAGGETSIGVLSNSATITATSDAAWCTVEAESGFIKLKTGANTGERRVASIAVKGSDGGTATITVRQLAPSSLLEITGITALNVNGESATSTAEGALSYVNDGSTTNGGYWHSDYANSKNLSNSGPYTLDFTVANVGKLSHIRYYPRQAATPTLDTEGNNQGGNGNFGQIEIWTKSGGDYVKAMDFACGEKGGMSEIVLPTPVDNVTGVRIVVFTGRGGHASCTEMQFFGTKK